MATPTATEEGLLCHCDVDVAGHPVEACGVKLGARAAVGWPRVRSYVCDGGRAGGVTVVPRGACPACGELVRIDRRTVFTTDRPDVHDAMPNIPVGFVVELRAHHHNRKPCAGGGQAPAETRYRCREVEAMLRDYGPDAVR